VVLFLFLSTTVPADQFAIAEATSSEVISQESQESQSKQSKQSSHSKSDLECLAETIYREAYSEPRIGQIAVAHVVINRLNDQRFPASICAVVNQRTGKLCQFSWVCHKRGSIRADYILKTKAVAKVVLNKQVPDPTRGAIFFQHKSISTHKKVVAKTVIGNHVFYKL
jgi:spore germination cell wall hydrolase CwlJ-like protein